MFLTTELDGRMPLAEVAWRDPGPTTMENRGGSRFEALVVDLKDTTYLDSSALGMLLLLRDHAGGDESDVLVVHASSDVRKILAISNFEKLFDIS